MKYKRNLSLADQVDELKYENTATVLYDSTVRLSITFIYFW